MDPRRTGQRAARLVIEYVAAYFRAVHRSPISMADRVRCYGQLLMWLLTAAGRSKGIDPATSAEPVLTRSQGERR
jgi:hypothetical protein